MFTRAGDLIVAYDLHGPADAPVLVLANSLGTSMHVWDDVVAPLATTYRVLRYDMRGHGLSGDTRLDSEDGVNLLADDLADLLGALGISRASIAGLSIGGMIAQRAAVRHAQHVEAIVLLGTGNRLRTRAVWNERIATVERDGVNGVVEGVLSGWFTPQTHAERPELIAGFATMLRRTPAAGYVFGCRAVRDADLRADDAAIRCPALVIAGSADPVAPPSTGIEMREAIPGARMVVIDDAAHIIPAERPHETAEAIRRFLDEVKT